MDNNQRLDFLEHLERERVEQKHANLAPVSTTGLCRAEQERKYFRTGQALRPSEGASALLVRLKAPLLCSSCSIEIRAAHASPLLWSQASLDSSARARHGRVAASAFPFAKALHQLKIGWNGPKGQHGSK
jgi:hypothetical protein